MAPARPPSSRAGARARMCVAVALLVWAAAAHAAPKCTITSVTSMVFTGYTPFGPGVAATSTIAYRCPQPIARAWLAISGARVLTAGPHALQLTLHQSPSPGPEWGPESVVPVPVGGGAGTATVFGFLPPQDAAAGSYQRNFGVSIRTDTEQNQTDFLGLVASAAVADACVIDAATLAFGGYEPIGANAVSPRDAQGTIRVACTRDTAYAVGLGPGSFASGSARHMANGAHRLRYELYTDAARATVWSTTTTVAGTATSTAPTSHVVHGRIAGGQAVGAGTYADTVQSTIEF